MPLTFVIDYIPIATSSRSGMRSLSLRGLCEQHRAY
jgi:hypothetical protein